MGTLQPPSTIIRSDMWVLFVCVGCMFLLNLSLSFKTVRVETYETSQTSNTTTAEGKGGLWNTANTTHFFCLNSKRLRLWATLHCILKNKKLWFSRNKNIALFFCAFGMGSLWFRKKTKSTKKKGIYLSKEVFSKILSFYSVQKPTSFLFSLQTTPPRPKIHIHTHTYKRLGTKINKPTTKRQTWLPRLLVVRLTCYILFNTKQTQKHTWLGEEGEREYKNQW